jgi:peptidoglycan/LPS O-acetylase OafA/YrhL
MGSSANLAPALQNIAPARRNTNLDALRGIAILMVLGRHAGLAVDYVHATNRFTFYTMRIGWAGVDLFFVLSGFLISGLLFSDYERWGRIHLKRFYIRRGFKIWPAFYTLIAVGLLIDAVMPGHHLTAKGLLPELTFFQDYFFGIWGITWSLAVEEHFYICLPLLLLFLIKRKPEKPFASLPWVFGMIAVFCLACRFWIGWNQDGTINYYSCVFPTHLRIDGLMFGVLICYFKRHQPRVFDWMATWKGGWVVIGAAVAVLSTIPVESRQMHTWGFTLLYVGAGFLVAKAVAFEGPRPIRGISFVLARMGVYSYSIYLWHMFYVWKVLPHFHIARPMVLYWATIGGAIVFGIVAAKAIEIPALHFRDRMFPAVARELAESGLVKVS